MRQSNAVPNVSVYAHLSGPFDYNKAPLAPMVCKVQVHDKTDKRGNWAYYSVYGWYLATPPEYYLTNLCHIKTKNINRITDTAQFSHRSIKNPTITPVEKSWQPSQTAPILSRKWVTATAPMGCNNCYSS